MAPSAPVVVVTQAQAALPQVSAERLSTSRILSGMGSRASTPSVVATKSLSSTAAKTTRKTQTRKKSLQVKANDESTRASSAPKHRRQESLPISTTIVNEKTKTDNEPTTPPARQTQKKILNRKSLTPAPPSKRGAHLNPTGNEVKRRSSFGGPTKPLNGTGNFTLPKSLALDLGGGTGTASKAKTIGKIRGNRKTDSISTTDHGVLSSKGRERQQYIAGRGTKLSTYGGVVNRKQASIPAPNSPVGGQTKPKAKVKKTRSQCVMIQGHSSLPSIKDVTPQVSLKRHSFQGNNVKAQPKTPRNKSKAKLKVTIENDEEASPKNANQLRSDDTSLPHKNRTVPMELSATVHVSSLSSKNTTPRGTRKVKGRKSSLDANTTHLPSRPSLGAHMMMPMGSNSDVEMHHRTRLTADDASLVREVKQPPIPSSSKRDNNGSKVKNRVSTSISLTFFGNPLVPMDIVDNECALTPKLNLMHHKDAIQVLEQIKTMQRGQLKVKVRPDIIESSRSRRPMQRKQTLDLKCIQILKTAGTSTSATLSMTGFKGGPLENQTNQDRSLIVSPFYLRKHSNSTIRRRLMGVFDGHAESGARFAEHCQQQLPSMLSRKLSEAFKKAVEDIGAGIVKHGEDEVAITKRVLIESFVALEESSPKEESGGCTATVVYQQGQRLFIANAGDSRSIIAVYRKNQHQSQQQQQQQQQHKGESKGEKIESEKSVKIVYMSREDKPDEPSEQERLILNGGEIILPEKNKSSKVRFNSHVPGKASATLGMSRSIGDCQFTPLGVIPDPIVDVVDIKGIVRDEMKLMNEIDSEDDVCIFAICVSDGMMIESDEDAVVLASVIAPSLFTENAVHPLTASQSVIQKTASVWDKRNKGKFRDDITIAVTVLRIPGDTVLRGSGSK